MTYFPSAFISNSEDPQAIIELYRGTVRDAVLEARMKPVMYEFYKRLVVEVEPFDLSREMIASADVFVGFYSGIYGRSVIDELNWAEFEYNYALSLKKPMILFFPHSDNTDFPQTDEKHIQFRNRIGTFYHTYMDRVNLKSNITRLLTSPNLRDKLQKRILVEPFFGEISRANNALNVFMIMPFRDELSQFYDNRLKPYIEKLGFSVKRGDAVRSGKDIITDVWSAINHADKIIVELADNNPNVFYELGIADTLGKEILLISQANPDDKIPFDIAHRRIIFYKPDNTKTLYKELRTFLNS
jgi:hypothetical protein